MRARAFGLVAAFMVAGGMSGCGDAPTFSDGNVARTAPAADAAVGSSIAAGVTSASEGGSPNRRPNAIVSEAQTASGTLTASMTCTYNYSTTYNCVVQMAGGSGSGYSFYWGVAANEYFDQGGVSKAYVECNKSNGSYSGYLQAHGTASDSNGNTAYASWSQSC